MKFFCEINQVIVNEYLLEWIRRGCALPNRGACEASHSEQADTVFVSLRKEPWEPRRMIGNSALGTLGGGQVEHVWADRAFPGLAYVGVPSTKDLLATLANP